MSKVYSFRLDDDNPREAQAREVMEAWADEGYSLRHVVVDALIYFKKSGLEQDYLNLIMEQLKNLSLSMKNKPATRDTPNATLSNSFLGAVKNSAKNGLRDQNQ